MRYKYITVLLFIYVYSTSIYGQEWELDIEPSHSSLGLAGYFPNPVPALISFSTLTGARNSAQFGIAIGPSFTDHYYFIIPEKEASFFWHSGVNWIKKSFEIESSNTVGSENFFQPYTHISLNQVLLGDRYHRNANLNITLQHKSSLYSPIDEDREGQLFFRHTPEIDLNLIAIEDPFWSVLGLEASLSLPLEMGHLSGGDSFWSFLTFSGYLNAKLPIISKYLYLNLGFSSEIILKNFVPQVDIPDYVYTNYNSQYHFQSQIDLKSRIIEFEPLYPMAIELGIFIMADYTTDQISTEEILSLPLKIGAYGEFKVEIPFNIMSLSVQAGVLYDISTKNIGFYLQI